MVQINEGMKAELIDRGNFIEALQENVNNLHSDLQVQKDLNYQMMLNYEAANAASFTSP